MRWYSTAESAREGQITVLAVVEAVIALAVYIAISLRTDAWMHLAIGCVVGWTVFLRTELSARLATRWFTGLLNRTSAENVDLWTPPARVIAISLGALVVRMAATSAGFLRHPWQALRTLPTNWIRAVFATDVAHPVEPVPGARDVSATIDPHELLGDPDGRRHLWGDVGVFAATFFVGGFVLFAITQVIDMNRGGWRTIVFGAPAMLWLTFLMGVLAYTRLRVVFALPVYVYRIWLKGTAIVFLPLIWVVRKSTAERSDRELLAQQTQEDPLARTVHTVSCFVVLLFGVKLIVFSFWNQVAATWNEFALARALDRFIDPARLPLWQIAGTFSACVSLFWYYQGTRWLRRYPELPRRRADRITTALRASLFVQGLLTLYTLACNLYIVSAFADRLGFVSFGPIVPW